MPVATRRINQPSRPSCSHPTSMTPNVQTLHTPTGAQVAGSAADVARQADITFAMLADPAAALEVATGPGGIVAGVGRWVCVYVCVSAGHVTHSLGSSCSSDACQTSPPPECPHAPSCTPTCVHTHTGLSPGKGYVDVSTIDPASSAAIAAAVKATGALHLEAPVSGSKGPAEQGSLIFLTAGDEGGCAGVSSRVACFSPHPHPLTNERT
jgi:3-hydroxyisobutyrate dehydrogenase-like beta-hydroxyacid dehydrogenase